MGEFEKDIRDMFGDLELQIDTDKLWSGIEKKLDRKDRKYPAWWIIAPVILLATIIVYTSINIATGKKTANGNDFIQLENSKINNNQQQNEQQKELNGANFNIKNKKDTEKKGTENRESKKNSKKNTIQNTNKTNLIATTNKKDKLQDETTSVLISPDTKEEENTKENIEEKAIIIEEKPLELIVVSSIPNKFNLIYIPEEIIYKGAFADYFDRKPVEKVDHWSNSMDFSLGFALVNKDLKAKTGDFNAYLDKRIATENYLEAFNSNFDFNLNHSSGFFIASGIHFTQIDERFKDIDSIDIYKENEGVTKEVQNGDGTISYLRGQKEVVEHITWDKVIYNYYSFIEIPVILGYHFDIKNISVELNSGLSYNLLLLKHGQIIGTEGFPVDIAEEKNIFKSQSGISFIAGIKVLFPVRKKLFFFEPNIKYNLQDITTDEYPLQQQYFNYGIKLGYRYKF